MNNELKRQILHILLGLFYIIIFYTLTQEHAIVALILIFGAGSFLSYTHAHIQPLPFIKEIIKKVERGHETNVPGKAALGFTLGILLTAIIFSQEDKLITIGSITALTFGDGFATIIGKSLGKIRVVEGKTMEGTIGGIIAATIALSAFFPPEESLATAIFAMLAEYIPINDNYIIPLVSGGILFLLI